MEHYLHYLGEKKERTAKNTFTIGVVMFSEGSFVVAESSFRRINICNKNHANRYSSNHYKQLDWLCIVTTKLV